MIQFMRGASSAVTSDNPTLQAGQPFYEIDTHKLKIGDGTTAWNDLPYIGTGGSSVNTKYSTVVVGTSNAGYNSDQVDYLCDGVDDQLEIQEAINSTPGCCTVLLLPGVYNISSSITLNKDEIVLSGVGFDTQVCTNGDVTAIIAEPNFNHNVYIENMSFDFNGQTANTIGIEHNSTWGVLHVINCLFSRFNGIAIQSFQSQDLAIIKNCVFGLADNCNIAIYGKDVAIESNVFNRVVSTPIQFYSTTNGIVSNNIIQFRSTGIQMGSYEDPWSTGSNIDFITISNNYFVPHGSTASYGICGFSCKGATISNNVVEDGTSEYGIYVGGYQNNVIVQGNIVDGKIGIGNGVANSLVINNQCTSVSQGSSMSNVIVENNLTVS